MVYIGIDISKSTFVVAFRGKTGYQIRTFENTVPGIRKFINTLSSDEHHCIMEATGNYSSLLIYLLNQKNIIFSVVNPRQIKHFARMMLSVVKTDSLDACLIAKYGEKMTPPVYNMPSETIFMLKQKRSVIRHLRKQLTATKNVRESMSVLPLVDKSCSKVITKTISFLEIQIEKLETELNELAKSEFSKQMTALTSIKGIGPKLATSLIIVTGGFNSFDNPKQVSRFLGICPTYQQSGTSLNIRGSINRNGDPHLRSLLYVATWSAIRYNASCKECYIRLKSRGKPSKVALFAVANKLIRQAFAVVKQDSLYVDGVVSDHPQNMIEIL